MQANTWERLPQQPSYIHWAPLTIQVSRKIRDAETLNAYKSSNEWHGRVLRWLYGLEKGIMIPVAFAEGTAALAVSLFCGTLNIISWDRSERLHRYSIKALAYSFSCYMDMLKNLSYIFKRDVPNFLWNCADYQKAYLGGAILAQLCYGKLFYAVFGSRHNHLEGIDNPHLWRCSFLLYQEFKNIHQDIYSYRFQDEFLKAGKEKKAAYDRAINIINQFQRNQPQPVNQPQANQGVRDNIPLINLPSLFFNQNPQYLRTIESLNIHQLFQENYRNELGHIFIRFCNLTGKEIPIDVMKKIIEKGYRIGLRESIKKAVVELYQHPAWILCFGDTVLQGQEAFDGGFAEVYLPLAYFAQLKELEEDLTCPSSFIGEGLQIYNERRQKLEAAKAELGILTAPAKELLIYKLLLKEERFQGELSAEERERAHSLFLKISALGAPLHQGRLMMPQHFVQAYQETLGEL